MAKKKKRKYFVDDKEASQMFIAFGFNFKRMNWFTYRVYHEEFKGFFDWFHTQGTVCANSHEKGYVGKLQECGKPEEFALTVNN